MRFEYGRICPDILTLVILHLSLSCSSTIGFSAKQVAHNMWLGPGCFSTSIIIHELKHILGFWHEHTRYDRNKVVRINWDEIRQFARHNFVVVMVQSYTQ